MLQCNDKKTNNDTQNSKQRPNDSTTGTGLRTRRGNGVPEP